jgi:hypothetical protein
MVRLKFLSVSAIASHLRGDGQLYTNHRAGTPAHPLPDTTLQRVREQVVSMCE